MVMVGPMFLQQVIFITLFSVSTEGSGGVKKCWRLRYHGGTLKLNRQRDWGAEAVHQSLCAIVDAYIISIGSSRSHFHNVATRSMLAYSFVTLLTFLADLILVIYGLTR